MNLNQAFKKRNRLQEELNELKNRISSKIIVTEEGEKENTVLLNGLTCEQWLEAVNAKTAELENLVVAIDKANEKIRPALSRLSIYKAQKAFLNNVNNYIVNAPSKEHYSADKTIYYRLNIKQNKVLAQIEELTKKIDNLEEEIQQFNAVTKILE